MPLRLKTSFSYHSIQFYEKLFKYVSIDLNLNQFFSRNTLTLLFHNGMSNNDKDFEVCLRAENVVLPKNGYFGISAATGGLADDHDVLKFNVFSLRSPEDAVKEIHDPESEKFDQEFNQYQDKLKLQKEQWAKENPEEVCVSPQLKIFKKELHRPSEFAKTGELFWPDFPRSQFFVYNWGAKRKD